MYSQQVQKIDDVPKVPEYKPKRLINIIDIDGCICESLFPNVENDKQSAAEIETLVEKVCSEKNGLYPEFIQYYRDILPETFYNFFVTGRKVSHFYKLTETQLSVLPQGSYFVKYYPEHREHTKKEYYGWKVNTIAALITSFSQKYDAKNPIIFRIFDDDNTYFYGLHFDFEHKDVYFTTFHIDSNEGWKDITSHIFGRHFISKRNLEEVFLL